MPNYEKLDSILEEFEGVLKEYDREGRFYHNRKHIKSMFYSLEKTFYSEFISLPITCRKYLTSAIVFHDVVYDPYRKDNEERSVNFFKNYFFNKVKEINDSFPHRKITPNLEYMNVVSSLILSSKYHIPDPILTDDLIFPEEYRLLNYLFIDLDLEVLSSDKNSYLKYTDNISKEYSFLSTKDYLRGRKAWVMEMLSKESIYFTESGKLKNKEARSNLKMELKIIHKMEGNCYGKI